MGPIRRSVPPKPCGSCQECCWALKVEELESPAGMPCRHQGYEGCNVYNTPQRPPICKDFYCWWALRVPGVPFRPDLAGVLVFQKGTDIVFRELRTGALQADWVFRAMARWPPHRIVLEKWDLPPVNLF